MRPIRIPHLLGACLLFLAACGQNEVLLPGQRLDVRTGAPATAAVNRAAPIRLAAPVNHTAWTHRAGTATHNIRHPAFAAAPALAWAVPVGLGNDRRHRITADPVAAGGRVFTLDSRATVAATATSGAPLWSRDLTPPNDNADDASGGGLALAGATLVVTTGFGDLHAINAADGTVLWRQKLEAPATGAPTVHDGLIYIVTRDSRAWAINLADGRVRWQFQSAPSVAGVVGGAGPAVDDRLAVFPFSSALVVGAFPKGGFEIWSGSVAGQRLGRVYAQLGDVTGDPVLDGGRVYVGSPAGRTVALDRTTGERIWTADEGAMGPVWPAGGSVFLVSDLSQLVRLDAATGQRIWARDLPHFVPARNQRRLRDIYPHFGPVLAGGRLWVASGDGLLRAFNPVDGALVGSVSLPGGAATRPIVVNRVMYVVSGDAQLLAFR